ncbi:MAG: flavodoxin family protein [Bacilli bacterium]|nr:flavodoxin family protein [Bacilli bacterium]
MKALILNGSPHNNGDTAFVINKVKERFPSDTEFDEINAYKDDIKPCIDCRYCWKNEGCSIKDNMAVILKDDYDVLIIASPIYISYVTPPLFSVFTRLNYIWSNKYFLNISNNMKKKKGILILVGGGNGSPDNAIDISVKTFKKLNAEFDLQKDYIYSLNTNTLPTKDDEEIINQIDRTISHILN